MSKMGMNSNVALFLGKAILKYDHQKLTFVPQKYMKCGNSEVCGWADNTEIRVATKRRLSVWLGVFIHETCHVDQCLSRRRWFSGKEDAVQKVDDWLGGARVAHIEKEIAKVIELEWDCERRAISKIKRNKLPINIKEYAKAANAYIIGYHSTLANRKWCKSSYMDKKVIAAMPSKLVSLKFALNPPKQYLDLYK